MTAKIVVGLRVLMDFNHYVNSGVQPPWLNIPELNFGPFARMLESRYHEKVSVRMADDYVDVASLIHFPDDDQFVRGAAKSLGQVLLNNSSRPSKNHTVAVSEEWKQIIPMQPRDFAPPPAWIFFVVSGSTDVVAGSWVASLRMDYGDDVIGRMAGRPESNISMPRTIKEELEKCLGIKLLNESYVAPILSPFH